jgi:hypothetical protein
MKAYTDLEQSRKLAEFLPLESADMCYVRATFDRPKSESWFVQLGKPIKSRDVIPCWSLSALLNVTPSVSLDSSDDHHYRLRCNERFSEWRTNPIDAFIEIIVRLKEEGLI